MYGLYKKEGTIMPCLRIFCREIILKIMCEEGYESYKNSDKAKTYETRLIESYSKVKIILVDEFSLF